MKHKLLGVFFSVFVLLVFFFSEKLFALLEGFLHSRDAQEGNIVTTFLIFTETPDILTSKSQTSPCETCGVSHRCETK